MMELVWRERGGLFTVETVVLGFDMIYGLFDQVVVGHVELDDFNFGFNALEAQILEGVHTGGEVAASENMKGGWEALGDELDDCKAKALIGTGRENYLRRHSWRGSA